MWEASPLNEDILSCSQRVETGQDSVAGKLHVIHWNQEKHLSHLFILNINHNHRDLLLAANKSKRLKSETESWLLE